MVFAERRSYASAALGVVILSVCPSVRLSVCHTHALWLIQRTYRRYFIPLERAILLVKCDFSYSCVAADKISTDLRARAVSLRQLSYLLHLVKPMKSALAVGHANQSRPWCTRSKSPITGSSVWLIVRCIISLLPSDLQGRSRYRKPF